MRAGEGAGLLPQNEKRKKTKKERNRKEKTKREGKRQYRSRRRGRRRGKECAGQVGAANAAACLSRICVQHCTVHTVHCSSLRSKY